MSEIRIAAAQAEMTRAPEPLTQGMDARRSRARQGTISFFGNFGTQNLGNESTLRAILTGVRKHLPGTAVNCICPGPEEASAEHGIAAVQMSYRYAPDFQARSGRSSKGFLPKLLRRLFIRVPFEIIEWVKAFRALKHTRMLVMTGTGMLGDFGIGPFDLHYEIFKWAAVAKLRGAQVLFVSVGAGPIDSRLSRWLVKRALSLADYRSYRDAFSKSYLAGIGIDTHGDSVYPDLAFTLRPDPPAVQGRQGAGRVVGIGLMDYFGKQWTESSQRLHDDYVREMAAFCAWLLERGYTLRLLIGDLAYDKHIKADVLQALRSLRADLPTARIVDEPVTSIESLVAQLSTIDVLVGTRFHNILLALLLHKPVVALSYHEKIDALMASVDLAAYVENVSGLHLDRLVERFTALERNAGTIKAVVARKVQEARSALDRQYEAIFAASSRTS